MTEDEARAWAFRLRGTFGATETTRLTSLKKHYVERAVEDRQKPGPVQDVLAWKAHFESDDDESLFSVSFTFDDETGAVLPE